MHIAVCDDNIADRKQMERLLQRSSDKRIHTTGVFYIDSYGNADAVLHAPMLYDVFFIDMTQSSVNGFQLARCLIDAGVTVPIVLCISSIDYRQIIAEAVLNFSPSDTTDEILHRQLQTQISYLDKPIRTDALEEALDHALCVKTETIPTIELRGEKDTLYVHEDEIMYAVRSDASHVHVTLTDDRSIDILSAIDNLHHQLTEFDHFLAISKKTIINSVFIHELSPIRILMKDGCRFRLSPLMYSTVKLSRQCSKLSKESQ